jgi:hypothetical protein
MFIAKLVWGRIQALKSAQIKVGELQDQVKKLSLKNSELRANLKGKKSNKGSCSVPSDHEKLIAQHAKKFGVMNEVFMPAAALAVKRPLTNSMDSGRYDSDIAELQGITAELYESLPDNFHDDLENSLSFRTTVSKFCSKASHRWSPLILLLLSLSSN